LTSIDKVIVVFKERTAIKIYVSQEKKVTLFCWTWILSRSINIQLFIWF